MSCSAKAVSNTEIVIVSVCAGITFVAVTWRIGNPALWYDEHTSLAFAQESWTDLFGRLWAADAHRPIYYALLKAWMAIFGYEQGTARVLGGVLAVGTVPLVWGIGRVLGGTRVGILAAALVALSPLFIAQARDLRMYPLFTFTILLAVLAVAVILRRGGNPGLWLLFAGAAALAFYTQATGILIVPLVGLALVAMVMTGANDPRILIGFLVASLLWFILILPGLWPAIFHTRETLANFWIPAPSLRWAWSQITGAYPYPALSKPIIITALVAGFYAAWRAERRAFWLCLVLVAGTPVLLLILSFIRPVLIVRAFVWTTVLAAVVMAFGLATLSRRFCIAGLAFLVGLQILVLRPYYPAEPISTDIDRLAPELANFNVRTDILFLGLISFEPNLRRNHPWLRDADMRALSHGDRREVFHDLLWSDHRNRAEASTMPLIGSLLWLIWETDPLFAISPEDDVTAALDAIRARGKVLRSVNAGRVRLEIIGLPPSR